jgi:hypothetical protein
VGTFNVLEAARLEKVDQVIYSSTIATYSKDIQSNVIDDSTLQRPTTMYGATKVFGELLGRIYARKFGIDFRGVRFPSVVGPGVKTAHMSIYHSWTIEEPLRSNSYEIGVDPETRIPVITFFTPGGGGMFPHGERESRLVEEDLRNEIITPEYAMRSKRAASSDFFFEEITDFLTEPILLRSESEIHRVLLSWSPHGGNVESLISRPRLNPSFLTSAGIREANGQKGPQIRKYRLNIP